MKSGLAMGLKHLRKTRRDFEKPLVEFGRIKRHVGGIGSIGVRIKDFDASKISGLVPEKSWAWQDNNPVERPFFLMGLI